jgi:carbon storage regulator
MVDSATRDYVLTRFGRFLAARIMANVCAWKETQMLVLSRKAKQRIAIGENIELVVVAVTGDRVKLGFNAPSDVRIYREEVRRRIRSEDQAGDLASAAALAHAESGTR